MNPDNTRTVVLLGATDPEMVEIVKLAQFAGATVVQATKDGRPVRPGELADGGSLRETHQMMLEVKADRLVLVEQPGRAKDTRNNTGSWLLENYAVGDNWPVQLVEVDHHDPAQTWPDEVPLWQRSSIGQLSKLLGVPLDPRMMWVGALDHDLPGAFAQARREGALDEVLAIYCSDASHLFGGVAPEVYAQQARETARLIHEKLRVGTFFGGEVVEFFRLPPDPATAGATGEHYPLPAIPLALALEGLAGLTVIRRKDGKLAWRLQCASAEQVRGFMERFECVRRDLPSPDNVYGQPERGFAGGLVSPEWTYDPLDQFYLPAMQ